MASVRGARSGREEDQPYRVPRNHQACHHGCHKQSTIPEHESRKRAAGPPCARPPRGLQAVANPLAQSKAGAFCRTCAERSRKTDRRKGTRDSGIQE